MSAGLDAVQAELAIGGMSCAACAARIEKKLARLDGVEAVVNFATERAYVASAGGRSPREIIAVVEAAGYYRGPGGPAGSLAGAPNVTRTRGAWC